VGYLTSWFIFYTAPRLPEILLVVVSFKEIM
jgi:hypothetical protein